MSQYDNTDIEKVASKGSNGIWACCLCTGWKARDHNHKDFKYNDHEIFVHLRDRHFIPAKILQRNDWKEKAPIDVALASALGHLMASEGGEAGDTRYQKRAWKKAEAAIARYEKETK